MTAQGFTPAAVRVDDGGWERNRLLYLIEIKTERESIIPQSTWWKWDKDPLLRQCDHIRQHYKSYDRGEFHQNKWMIVIAQLRAGILRLSNVNRNYRAIFVIPSVEVDNFKRGFERYHNDRTLNTAARLVPASMIIWQNHFDYIDQRGIQIQVSILEIDCDNYFGHI